MCTLHPIPWSFDPCNCAAIAVASSILNPLPQEWWPLKTKHLTGFSTITCEISSMLGFKVSVIIHSFDTNNGQTGDSVHLLSNGITCTPKSKAKRSLVFCGLNGLRWGDISLNVTLLLCESGPMAP